MKRILSLSAAAAAALLHFSSPALAGGTGPSVAKKDGVGSYLVDGAGQTLYVFKKDSPGQSACQGECVAKWPIYLAEGAPAGGLKAEDLGTITRADGKKQTTYKGLPLYYFAADKAAGDTKGQGLKEVWFVATP
jgi:predicted lipoprotein with Yx(FWY)xxD motif